MSSPRKIHSNLRIPNNIVCIQMSPQQMETKSIPPSQPLHRPNQTIQLSQITIYPLRLIIKWRYAPQSSHVFHRKQASGMDHAGSQRNNRHKSPSEYWISTHTHTHTWTAAELWSDCGNPWIRIKILISSFIWLHRANNCFRNCTAVHWQRRRRRRQQLPSAIVSASFPAAHSFAIY